MSDYKLYLVTRELDGEMGTMYAVAKSFASVEKEFCDGVLEKIELVDDLVVVIKNKDHVKSRG